MFYRLFMPREYDRQTNYPLVLWLHGSGGGDKILNPPPGFLGMPSNRIGWWRLFGHPETQGKYPSFVVVPRCPSNMRWDNRGGERPSAAMRLVLQIVQSLGTEFNLDSRRFYVIGASLGGYGSWDAIARYPIMFAAAVPMCGGGDVSNARLISRTPVWAFHGERDEVVSVEESRRMIAAIKRVGGQPRYTEYAGVGHNCWDRAYAEPDLLSWMFGQNRT